MKYTIVPNKDSDVYFKDLPVGEWFTTGVNNLYMKIYDILSDDTVEGVYNVINPIGCLSYKSEDKKVKKCKVELHINETLGEENERVIAAIQSFNIGDVFLIENDYFIITNLKIILEFREGYYDKQSFSYYADYQHNTQTRNRLFSHGIIVIYSIKTG